MTLNQAWEETLLVLGDDLYEGVLESLHEWQLRKSTLMKNSLELCQSDIVQKKEPTSSQTLDTTVIDIFE